MFQLKELKEQNFEKIISQSGKTTLVDFYSPTCSPCTQVVPILSDLIKKHPQINVYKIDVNKSNGLSAKYHILSLPTLLIFKNGQVIGEMIGSVNSNELEKFITSNA